MHYGVLLGLLYFARCLLIDASVIGVREGAKCQTCFAALFKGANCYVPCFSVGHYIKRIRDEIIAILELLLTITFAITPKVR